MNASTTSRCRVSRSSRTAGAPRTRRRARLASCRAAAGVRPTIAAISSNGKSNMSCSTKASRSAGSSVSSTTSSASPTESASCASSSGFVAGSIAAAVSSAGFSVERFLAARLAGAQHVEAHARDHRREPSAEVVDVVGFGAREPQPCLLHRVLGLAERAQHPVGHTPQVSAMGLESLRQPVVSVAHPFRYMHRPMTCRSRRCDAVTVCLPALRHAGEGPSRAVPRR